MSESIETRHIQVLISENKELKEKYQKLVKFVNSINEKTNLSMINKLCMIEYESENLLKEIGEL